MIGERYTLFVRIPLYLDREGGVFATDLWAKDLALHLGYLGDFRLCCPVLPLPKVGRAVVPVEGLSADRIFPLRLDRGWGSVFRNLLPNFRAAARAARWSEIVHSGGSEWAFPLSYYLLLLRPLLSFRWVILIESTFWMKPRGGRARPRLSHHLHLFLLRRCVRAADARIFTQDWYREVFLGSDEAVLIAPAVWIDAETVEPEAARAARVAARRGPARLVFPARLIADKGVETVLSAVEIFEARHGGGGDVPRLVLDIVGEGELAARCRAFAEAHSGAVKVGFREPVPYGAPFRELLRGYDAVVVANRKPEQPRIVFDAFGQGLPCLSTRTPGVEGLVREGETGCLFAVGDAGLLADLFARVADDPGMLAGMGATALGDVRGRTHAAMHREREAFLREVLSLRA